MILCREAFPEFEEVKQIQKVRSAKNDIYLVSWDHFV